MNDIIYAGKHVLTVAITRHTHPSWELVYCVTGNGCFHFDNRTISYASGEMVVIPPNVPHANSSSDGFTNIHLNMDHAAFSFQTPIVIQDDNMQTLLGALNAAYFHYHGDRSQKKQLMAAYGDLICSFVNTYNKSQPLTRVVEEIESNIIENYHDFDYHLDEYLQSLPFSYNYLRKLFKKEMGVTPHTYLVDKRLQTAVELLNYNCNCGNNISEIAFMCGFRDPLYFSRMFKKKYKVAPSYYLIDNRQTTDAPLTDDDLRTNLDETQP